MVKYDKYHTGKSPPPTRIHDKEFRRGRRRDFILELRMRDVARACDSILALADAEAELLATEWVRERPPPDEPPSTRRAHVDPA